MYPNQHHFCTGVCIYYRSTDRRRYTPQRLISTHWTSLDHFQRGVLRLTRDDRCGAISSCRQPKERKKSAPWREKRPLPISAVLLSRVSRHFWLSFSACPPHHMLLFSTPTFLECWFHTWPPFHSRWTQLPSSVEYIILWWLWLLMGVMGTAVRDIFEKVQDLLRSFASVDFVVASSSSSSSSINLDEIMVVVCDTHAMRLIAQERKWRFSSLQWYWK